jgi:hypothetical protein
VVFHLHVAQHHAAAEEQGRRVGQVLARDIWGSSVNSLKNGGGLANIAATNKKVDPLVRTLASSRDLQSSPRTCR